MSAAVRLSPRKVVHSGYSSGYTLPCPDRELSWLDAVGRAVASGRLSHEQGRTIATTVREWLKAHEAGKVAERVEEHREQVTALRQRQGLKAEK